MSLEVAVLEEEQSKMLFSKLRQVVSQKFGYGVRENKAIQLLLKTMNPCDLSRIVGNGALYHIKRIYRELFTLSSETAIVTVQEGKLKGRKLVSVLGKPYYRFQGIPYAKPPIGPLRFKNPEPPEPWPGVRSALKEGDISIQLDLITGICRGNEDCLFLNIFTPELPKDGVEMEKKAVMVWIHGGGFYCGSGNAEVYGPDFLIDDDVLLVTLNYRLGVMGFLCAGTEEAPGNAGLKDIVQALKWIQKNISVFGGDPNKVTIFGESAGAASVHYLMLSPMAKGLFSRAIAQSGCALCPWAVEDEDPCETSFKLGKAFGLETNDPDELVNFLRKIPSKVLVRKQTAALSEKKKRECLPIPFLPCVERPSVHAFITESPKQLLKNKVIVNDVPFITGITELEGTIALKPVMDGVYTPKELDEDFERLVPRFLNLPYGSKESKEVADKIREFYFKNRSFDGKTFKEYVDLTTDVLFLAAAEKTSKLHAEYGKSPVYNYHFLFDGDFAFLKKLFNIKFLKGPLHADDIGYLFHIPILGPNTDSSRAEMKFTKKMVRMWTNFAKFGNPTPHSSDSCLGDFVWKPFTIDNPNYLAMAENLSNEKNLNKERLDFWKEITRTLET